MGLNDLKTQPLRDGGTDLKAEPACNTTRTWERCHVPGPGTSFPNARLSGPTAKRSKESVAQFTSSFGQRVAFKYRILTNLQS